jgi:hypothetical protein
LITVFTVLPLFETDTRYPLPVVTAKNPDKENPESSKMPALSPQDYVDIADQNLFHPDRKIPPEKKEQPPLPMPDFVLYGTLITPELSLAYLEDKKAPVSTPGRGARQTALKKGESLSGFVLKEVLADRVVMARGEDTLAVQLTDPKSPKTREVAAPAKAQPATPGAPSARPGAPAAPTPGRVETPAALPRPSVTRPGQPVSPAPALSGPPSPGTTTATPSTRDIYKPATPRYRTVPAAPSAPAPYP